MQDWVKRKLENVFEVYTPERIARSKERWRRLWQGEEPLDRYPFVYAPVTFNYYDVKHTPEGRLRATLDEFLARGTMEDDFIPTIFPGCHVGAIPGMFGAKEIICDGDYSCDRLLFSIDEVDCLPEPTITEGSVAHGWLQMQQYLLEETEGQLPIHVADMQGPADVCGKLLGYDELFIGAYTDPDAYHKLMSAVTAAFILFWQRQQELLGDVFVGTHLWAWSWVPAGLGATLSADSLVMISPDFFDEFYRPYLEQVAKHFGGVTVHSCGNFSKVVPNLCAVPGLKAVNTSQMTLPMLLDAGLDTRKPVIMFTDSVGTEEIFHLTRQHHLRIDLTIAPDWPKDGDRMKRADEWTAAELDQVQREHERIVAAATV